MLITLERTKGTCADAVLFPELGGDELESSTDGLGTRALFFESLTLPWHMARDVVQSRALA